MAYGPCLHPTPPHVDYDRLDTFPPAFDGLLPEGVLLDQLLAKHKLDRWDKWGQLLSVGQDLSGFVSVLPEGKGNLFPIQTLLRGGGDQRKLHPQALAAGLSVGSRE